MIDAQEATIRELSTPLIPLDAGILVMPLVGRLDRVRIEQLLERLLQGVVAQRAATVILDVTGVPVVDAEIADSLIRAAQAVKLLEAGEIMDALFWRQTYGDKDGLLSTIDDPATRRFVEINYGPWDRLDNDAPFVEGAGPRPPGARFYPADMSKEESIAFCERLFEGVLGGHKLISNAAHLRGSAQWIRFPRVVCRTWVHHNGRAPVVLMGDAAHTAHFSVGSGTKLALEDAIELSRCIGRWGGHLGEALADYEAVRSVEVLKIQNAARNSTEWFEHVDRYTGMEIQQFTYSLLTRSQRISHENLRLRDAKWLEGYEDWLQSRAGGRSAGGKPTPPMLLPLKVRGVELKNRIVVSPMAQYKAQDGVVGDWHLMHLGARAVGGAALVMVEMTSPTPEGRITPGCPGLWNDAQQAALARIVDFARQNGGARMGLQLGHSGPKGSTQLGWEAMDEPLATGNWPLLSASALPYGQQNQVPKAMTRADMDAMTAAFVESTQRAAAAGFDWLELHCAHGYLLSAFICPLTNQRSDGYGGSLENRCRYPLEVFAAMRAAWPADKPMSVRISAHDWAPGGNTPDDAVAIARLFKAAGCDVIDVSSGQTTRQAKPVYGRMYQTPFADRIRNEVNILTMAVGAISEADHANSIIGAGRADLCAVARPHLADPAWTLHEAAKLQTRAIDWPLPYLSGRDQLYREIARQQALQGTVVTQDPAETS